MARLGVIGPTTQAFFNADPDDHISAWLKAGTYYEVDLLEAIRALELGGTYVDVGAHIGNHSIYFALECKAERVLAIEPLPESFQHLNVNISDNRLTDKITTVNALIHPSWKGAHVAAVEPKNSGMARFEKKGDIRCLRLDDILPEDVSLIKVDVEGSALEVLKTAERVIKDQRPVLAVEAINEKELTNTHRFLSPFGYEADGPYAFTPVWIWKP